MEERRKLKRRYLLAEVKIRPVKSETWINAVLLNISRGGLGLYAMEPVRKKEHVVVKITYLEHSKMKEVEEIPGTIQWVQQVGTHHGAGIMFSEKINKKNFPILSQCLEYSKSNK